MFLRVGHLNWRKVHLVLNRLPFSRDHPTHLTPPKLNLCNNKVIEIQPPSTNLATLQNHLQNRIMLEWFALLAICTWAHWLKASRRRGSLKLRFRFRHAPLWAAPLIIWNANWNPHQQQQAPVLLPAPVSDLHPLNHHRSSIGVIVQNHRSSSSSNCKARPRKWVMWTNCWMHTTWRCWAPVISGWSWHTGSGVTKRCGNSSSRTSSTSTRFCCSISWALAALTPNTSTSQGTLRYMLTPTICSPSWTRWRLRAASTSATPCLEWLGASPPSSGLPCSRSSSCSPQLPSKSKQPWLNRIISSKKKNPNNMELLLKVKVLKVRLLYLISQVLKLWGMFNSYFWSLVAVIPDDVLKFRVFVHSTNGGVVIPWPYQTWPYTPRLNLSWLQFVI